MSLSLTLLGGVRFRLLIGLGAQRIGLVHDFSGLQGAGGVEVCRS